MRLTTRVGLLAGASALALSGASFGDGPVEANNLEARIAELEAQLAALSGDAWLTEQRSDEIRSLVQDVLADADTRASLLQNGAAAGYDDGFFIGSSDGNFSLKFNGLLQFRFIWNNQEDGSYSSVDSNRWGFENTRTKLMFSGNVFNPQWKYYIEGNFYRNGGAFSLEDAWIEYEYGNGWSAKAGQFKMPVLREWLVHSMNQLAIERSATVYFVPTAVRTQGFAFNYTSDQFRFTGSWNDGTAGANSVWSAYDTEWSFSGRAEALLSGEWGQFDDFTSPQGSAQGFMVGGGFHYQTAEYGTAAANELETLVLTADASFEFDGGNLFGAIYYTSWDNDAGFDLEQLGFVVQGGYYFNADWEGFARFEWNDFDMVGVDDQTMLTLGVNRYWGENVKWSADFGYGFDQIYSPVDITGQRSDLSDEDGQIVFRTQFQLDF